MIYGTSDVQKSDYDKLETIVITLNTEGLESENDLIRYLSLLLNREMPLQERQEKLEKTGTASGDARSITTAP